MTRLEFRILGPLSVWTPQRRAVELGARKQRAVLAMLLLEPGRVVSVDRIVDGLWGADVPASATGTLQAYISQLRRALEPDRAPRTPPAVLLTQEPGYLLAAAGDRIDAVRFTTGVEAARAQRDPERAEQLLTQALANWSGEALADFADETFAAAAVARLNELRDGALEDLAEIQLGAGRPAAAVASARALLERRPFRERSWAQLMLGLYREGRQAEALAAFRQARTVLDEELGLPPGPELTALETAILQHDPKLAGPRSPLVAQAARTAQPARSEDAGTDPGRKAGNDPGRLVGRQAEQRRIADRIEPVIGIGMLLEVPDSWDYRFSHALVRDTVYGSLTRLQRARLHKRVGEALEAFDRPDDPEHLGRLVHHFTMAARLGVADRAVRYARRAAELAMAQLAYDEAARYLESALGALDPTGPGAAGERGRLLVQLGLARRAAGDLDGTRAVLDEALTLARPFGDDELAMDAATLFGGATLWTWRPYLTVDERMIAILREQLDRLGPDDVYRRAVLLGTLAVELYHHPDREQGEAHAAEAVRLARGLGDPELLARTLNNAWNVAWVPQRLAERRATTDELLAIPGLPRTVEVMARLHRMITEVSVGDVAGFDADLARAVRLAEEIRSPVLPAQVRYAQAGRAMLAGDWEAGERLVGEAFALQEHTSLWGTQWIRLAMLYTSRRFQGRAGELRDELIRSRTCSSCGRQRSWPRASPVTRSWRGRLSSAGERPASSSGAGTSWPSSGPSWPPGSAHPTPGSCTPRSSPTPTGSRHSAPAAPPGAPSGSRWPGWPRGWASPGRPWSTPRPRWPPTAASGPPT
ncbi:BTAD domain-containing putative transcriptional regulator [Dactylosporangium matsuzakiense]|uniref:BTAD domain-containing putative transcriptional regulator n=1 Tax=Dactylosporangium matsuzakiense TaxID=53360 RepID=UPI0021C498AF|nr:BTAD domain-containing putative transcriptional regulator [Dactylosporangium matsuzakiense]UWZ44431.1 winged helix-turn-helix domain-containing protein [Dactylosporangium matsuzakiense]